MKITLKVLTIILAAWLVGCNNKENTTTLQELQGVTPIAVTETFPKDLTTDSIAQLNGEIESLKNSQLSKKEEIAFLSQQRDSIQIALQQLKQSVAQINSKKIEPGIAGVNTKLAELKGQKENLVEQQDLKKREVLLAEKKLVLLTEEKEVYEQQRKSLYDKGATPDAFTQVETLLTDINSKMELQQKTVKTLTRSIDDLEEQKVVIDKQRGSMSSKIRDNYSAKQIFDEFSKEEQERLNEKLTSIETSLENILSEDQQLDQSLAITTNRKNSFETQKNKLEQEKAIQETNDLLAQQNAALESQQAKKDGDNKKWYALIGVGVLAIIFLLFYRIGKAKRTNNKQTNN